jgi:DNA helicase-2/ATP-dependent DNA helicase PcrA
MEESTEPTLGGFLEETALFTDADEDDGGRDKVMLMTIHSAKGLEFDNVFLIGMEDGIFPGSRSLDNEDDMEEERRLAYVAVTRAKKQLYVTSAGRRMIFGQTQHNVTSRFIREIGKEHYIKQDNYTKNKDMHDNSVTEVQSLSLQQQIAMAKRQTAVKATNTTYEAGERVSHKIFGEGTIISATPASNDYMLEIAFDKVGTKKIMANFAKITKLN